MAGSSAFRANDGATSSPWPRQAGLDAIEWIYDESARTSIPSPRMRGRADAGCRPQTGVAVRSVCADYFMDGRSCARPTARSRSGHGPCLAAGRCALLGATRVVLPFVDASRSTRTLSCARSHRSLGGAAGRRRDRRRTPSRDLTCPRAFADCSRACPSRASRSTTTRATVRPWDIDPRESSRPTALASGSVHIKDRVHGRDTVPLGDGDADFEALFACLEDVATTGDYVLQVARGAAGDEVAWARHNREFVPARLVLGPRHGPPADGQRGPRGWLLARHRARDGAGVPRRGLSTTITGRDRDALPTRGRARGGVRSRPVCWPSRATFAAERDRRAGQRSSNDGVRLDYLVANIGTGRGPIGWDHRGRAIGNA